MSKRQKRAIQEKQTPVNNEAVRSFLSWAITEMSMKTIIKHHLHTSVSTDQGLSMCCRAVN